MRRKFIALAGPPCSGKSAAGAKIAELVSLDFVETDLLVEEASGVSISRIFSTRGEAAFRTLEKEAVRKALSRKPCVIALGGGTLLDSETRTLVESKCTIFTLWASPETLASRNRGGRPLAASEEMFTRLLKEREEHYASLPRRLCTGEKTPGQVAMAILEMLRKEDPALWSP